MRQGQKDNPWLSTNSDDNMSFLEVGYLLEPAETHIGRYFNGLTTIFDVASNPRDVSFYIYLSQSQTGSFHVC